MKKYLFFAAAVAITACTNDTLIDDTKVPDTKEVAIGFGTGMNKMTRGTTQAENSSATTENGLNLYYDNFTVWGYKNIKTSEGKYSHTTVFKGDDAGAVDDESINTYNGTAWEYSPIRYWDKSATNYSFYAAAPSTQAWIGNETLTTSDDAVTPFYFTLVDFSLTNKESLPLSSTILTGSTDANSDNKADDAFQKDVDLMIANDVPVNAYSTYTTTPVNFDFNHILSRLNIAVKTDIVTKYKPLTDAAGNQLYTDPTNEISDYLYKDASGKFYYLKDNTATGGTAYDPVYTYEDGSTLDGEIAYSDEVKEGKVVLKSVKVLNMVNKGSFNEDLASAVGGAIDAATLAAGTDKRWTLATSTQEVGFPSEQVTGPITLTEDQVDYAGTTIDKNTYMYVYQGLVIPQTVEYDANLLLDGSNATTSSKPYLQISYEIDGEPYTYTYNLAYLFSNLNAQYEHPTYGKAYKLDGGGYAYEKSSDTWYNSDGTTAATVPGWAKDTDDERIPATYADLLAEGRNVCDFTFCEGWQNNLYININPAAIKFTAKVFEWVTKSAYEIELPDGTPTKK